jgi:CopG family nickel-responsive transcriptional regulator
MRDFLSEKHWTMEEDIVAGVITMLYNHDIKGLIETVKRLEHSYLTQICSTTHIHFETGDCVEILAVRGESKHIKDLTRELAIIRGVKQIKLAVLSP